MIVSLAFVSLDKVTYSNVYTFILPVFCLIKSLIIETHSIQISTIHHSKTVSQHVLGVRNWRILFCLSTLSPFCCIFQTKQNFT